PPPHRSGLFARQHRLTARIDEGGLRRRGCGPQISQDQRPVARSPLVRDHRRRHHAQPLTKGIRMAQQPSALAALTSPKVFSALTGVILGTLIFFVGAWSMGYLTKPTEEQLAEQALNALIPEQLSRDKNSEFLEAHAKQTGVKVEPSGLHYRVIKAGTGKKPESATATVKVHYTGKFIDGTTFDSSAGGEPVEFPLNRVIKGWTEGLQLMQVGEKAEFVIPYDLAYGETGRGEQMPPYQ